MKCNKCNILQELQHPCIIGRGCRVNAKIMFIQDCPDEKDDTEGKVLAGKSGNTLVNMLQNRGIDVSKVYLTSLVKCAVDSITSTHLYSCKPYLEDEIETVDPDIIVPMGNQSLKYCIGRVGLTKVRGNAQEVELCGRVRIILPMVNPKAADVKPIYKDYICKDLDTLKDLYNNGMTQITGVNYRYLETVEDITEELLRLKNEAKYLVFDIETTGKSPYMEYSKIVCISFTDKSHYGVVIPLYKHDNPLSTPEIGYVVKLLRYLMEDESIPKCAHNGKFDIEWLKEWLGIDVANFSFDTMLAHYLCISEEQGTQGLKSQAWEFTDMGGYDNELDEYVKKLSDGDGLASRYNYDRVPWDILKTYAAADADCCFRLMEIYQPKIQENDKWVTVMRDIMIPGTYALEGVEANGMKMDMDTSQRYSQSYSNEIQRIKGILESYPEVLEIEREKRALWQHREELMLIPKKDRTPEQQREVEVLKKYKDFKFNWNSVTHLSELLYDKLQLTTSVLTDKGKPSTNEDAMNELAEQGHSIPTHLLALRKVTTLNNMFIQKLPTMRDPHDIVHTSFSMSGTVTGRLSSENPNFQQVPRKTENPTLFQYHNEPKALFVSRYGKDGCILNADYAALEMRIAAVISNDGTMQKALLSGADIHKANASYIWNVPIDKVTKEQRTAAKSLGFGIVYGKSGVTFAKDLYFDPRGKTPGKFSDWEKAKAEGFKLVDHFLGTFTGLRDWLEKTKAFAHKHGYVETMFGRRRRLPDLNSKVPTLQANAERQAINAPIQGTGSDLTMLSVIHINNFILNNGMKSKMIATVHDSIVFDIYIPELSILAPKIKEIMESVHKPYIDTIVPIRADLELGANYGGTFEVELDDIIDIHTGSDFFEWNHEQCLHKYLKEIQYLQKLGWKAKDIQTWCKNHNRPWDKLLDMME